MTRLAIILFAATAAAQDLYVTGVAGFAALSAATKTSAGPPPTASTYSPSLGPAINAGVGWHFNDWFSVQGNYIWNRNDVTFMRVAGDAFSERPIEAPQHAFVADLLLYFRPRTSRIRPYLSCGTGPVRFSGPSDVDGTRAGLRVAVGIDLLLKSGWGFRYSFSETISGNPFAAAMSPRSDSALMNFQNLFGFVKYF